MKSGDVKNVVRMRKVLLIGILVLGLVFCKGVQSPHSPEIPGESQYVTYTVKLEVGVSATLSPTYVFNVYGVNDAFLKTLTIPTGSVGTGIVKVSANFQMLKTSSEETHSVKWKLMSCSAGSAWASGAIYQYWMTVTAVSSGITVDPTKEQRVGPFKGWNIGEIKQMAFKIKKN